MSIFDLQNFGFVVFDSPGPVQDVLQEKVRKYCVVLCDGANLLVSMGTL